MSRKRRRSPQNPEENRREMRQRSLPGIFISEERLRRKSQAGQGRLQLFRKAQGRRRHPDTNG